MTPARGRFPSRLVVEPAGENHFTVTDPRTRTTWRLGANELAVARMFTGTGTYQDVADAVRRTQARGVTAASVQAFESRLLDLGVLDDARPSPARRVLRTLAALDSVDVGRADPTRVLDAVLRYAPWLVHRVFAVVSAIVSVLVLVLGWKVFTAVPGSLPGWGLAGLLVVTAVSSVFHEGGHALACRALGVPVREVGIGLRSLALFAWTEPDQGRWTALPLRHKVITAVAGPLGSLVFAALGVLLWHLVPGPLGVWMVLAGTVCIVPTLLPSFDGDAYVLLTSLPGMANLRSRSFAHARAVLRGARPTALLGFALVTVLGRAAVAAAVVWIVWAFAW